MADRDWEGLAAALDVATGDYSRAELVELLRDLIAEYVVGRGLPTGTASAAATPDVGALNFADLVRWLKRASSAPELQRFTVDGQRVVVDLDGPRVISGASDDARPASPASNAASTPAASRPAAPGTGAPGIGFVDATIRRPTATPGAAPGAGAGNPSPTPPAQSPGGRAGNPGTARTAGNPGTARSAPAGARPAPPLPPAPDAPPETHEDGTPKRGLSKGFRGLEFD